MKMTKKRVVELEGVQLDWAVAKALGIRTKESVVEVKHPFVAYSQFCDAKKRFVVCRRYSSEWSFGGPIIERELDGVHDNGADGLWRARGIWKCQLKRNGFVGEGPTPLIAAMRAFVASKLGDEVEVPE